MGKFSEDELALAKGFFEHLDSDGSGSLDADDITAALEGSEVGPDLTECINELLEADTNGDGKVSLAEFIAKLEE